MTAPVVVDVEAAVESIVAVDMTASPFLTLKSIVFAISFPFHVTAQIANLFINCGIYEVIVNLVNFTTMVLLLIGVNVMFRLLLAIVAS
jgi:hypothetical protein